MNKLDLTTGFINIYVLIYVYISCNVYIHYQTLKNHLIELYHGILFIQRQTDRHMDGQIEP